MVIIELVIANLINDGLYLIKMLKNTPYKLKIQSADILRFTKDILPLLPYTALVMSFIWWFDAKFNYLTVIASRISRFTFSSFNSTIISFMRDFLT